MGENCTKEVRFYGKKDTAEMKNEIYYLWYS